MSQRVRIHNPRALALNLALSSLSAVLLILSFPKFDMSALAWVALVPLLVALEGKSLRQAFLLSYLTGAIESAGVFSWIFYVTGVNALDVVLLDVYLATYLGLWGLALCWLQKRTGLSSVILAPTLWVAQEFIRAHLFFLSWPLMLLGHSQYLYPSLIQITSVVGAYGLSFLIILMNAGIANMLIQLKEFWTKHLWSYPLLFSRGGTVVLNCLLLGATYGYGRSVVVQNEPTPVGVRIALIQGNIERSIQWDRDHRDSILDKYEGLTRQVATQKPALIVWPESAVPGDVQRDAVLNRRVAELAKEVHTYLLIGTVERGKFQSSKASKPQPKVFNSLVLFSPEGQIEGEYHKIGLIPFGEYVPLDGIIKWPRAIAPAIDNIAPGDTFTLFTLDGTPFASMICWEVMYPDLFREFIKRGAQFMVNANNEIWFGTSSLTYQYLAVSAIQAAQNRVPVARVGNTGVTAFIDRFGRISRRLRNDKGQEIFVEGTLIGEVVPSRDRTFYTKYGDVFAHAQLYLLALLAVYAVFSKGATRRVTEIVTDNKAGSKEIFQANQRGEVP